MGRGIRWTTKTDATVRSVEEEDDNAIRKGKVAYSQLLWPILTSSLCISVLSRMSIAFCGSSMLLLCSSAIN